MNYLQNYHQYPEHLLFLESIARPQLDIGIQSFDRGALNAVDRPFREARFHKLLAQLHDVADLEVELIMGLPGDTPEQFAGSVRQAMALPATLRIFHCLALPDALLDTSLTDPSLVIDPHSLKIESCDGWSAEDIVATSRGLDELVAGHNGEHSAGTWQLPPPGERSRDDMRSDPAADGRGLSASQRAEIATCVDQAAGWRLLTAHRQGAQLLVTVEHPDGEAVLSLVDNAEDGRCYRRIDGVRCSYRVTSGASPTADATTLDAVLESLSARAKIAP